MDNGCSYSNAQLSMICVSLGILLLHTRVRDGASKGKVERHFRTLKVRKDSTISIDKVCYDVPMQFISAKVEVRYLPDDMTSAYILFDGEKFPIRQTSRNDNCHTRRNNPPAIDYSKAGGEA